MSTFFAVYENGEFVVRNGDNVARALADLKKLPGTKYIFERLTNRNSLGDGIYVVNEDQYKDITLKLSHLELIDLHYNFRDSVIKIYCHTTETAYTENIPSGDFSHLLGTTIKLLTDALKYPSYADYKKSIITIKENNKIKNEIEQLRIENERLKSEIESLKNTKGI
jgi:hypothetical protein